MTFMPMTPSLPLKMGGIALWMLLCLAGCQSKDPAPIGQVLPIYRTAADAQAVASGQFGATPVAFSSEAELTSVAPPLCGQKVMEVRTKDGQRGWTPLSSLSKQLGAGAGNAGPWGCSEGLR